MGAINRTFSIFGVRASFSQAFACELVEEKRKWIDAVMRCPSVFEEDASVPDGADYSQVMVADRGEPCIFKDVEHMAKSEAECWRHGGCCPVVSVDLLVVGTSCKDMSRASASNNTKRTLVLSQGHSKGGSAQTFRGFLGYVSQHRPLIILFDNVDTMEEDTCLQGGSNMDILLAEMAARGYEGQKMMTDAAEFGLPARRRRVYVFFARVVANPLIKSTDRPVDTIFATFLALVGGCVRAGPCASKVLLSSDDPAVLKERARRTARAAEVADNTDAPDAAAARPPAEWPMQHFKRAADLGVRWAQKPPQDLLDNEWFLTLCARERDALLLSRATHHAVLFRDLSQSLGRGVAATWKEEAQKHVAPTQMPSAHVWVEVGAASRVMLGRESLVFQGFPVKQFLQWMQETAMNATGHGCQPGEASARALPEGVLEGRWPPESLMQDLAGHMLALPVVLGILQAGLAALIWQAAPASSAPPASKEDAVRDIL